MERSPQAHALSDFEFKQTINGYQISNEFMRAMQEWGMGEEDRNFFLCDWFVSDDDRQMKKAVEP